MSTIAINYLLTEISCAACGVCFAVPEDFQTQKRNTGEEFYCPNGHTNVFRSRLKELEEKLFQAEASLRSAKCETIAERTKLESTERKLKRIKQGVCPCCNRSFQNLRRHLKTKHPQFIKK